MTARSVRLALFLLLLPCAAASAAAQAPLLPSLPEAVDCVRADFAALRRNPTPLELRCRYGIYGPGRFGLASYMDVPVYQPRNPLPGTHVVGVPGLPKPRREESYEAWEMRVLRTQYGPEARRVHRGLEVLDPVFAERILRLERALAEAGVRANRRETWRSPERQAYIFQQGRSRPGSFATSTLTSWHSRVDGRGNPAGRAVDYDVPASQMPRFHQVVRAVGLESYGADSFDPGHVFLPGEESFSATEVAMLRLLPQVPVVTLATGRPEPENATRSAILEFREMVRELLDQPFAMPRVDAVLSLRRAPTVRAAVLPAPPPEPEQKAPARRPARRRTSSR
ncbi:MAG TPA: hypothetical protein VHG28_22605 [Longimicrobiaceae bacterium]|nr:hypothetical protein [Longimicrobiaceae bacterium]